LRFNLLSKDASSHLEISEKSLQTEKKDQLYYLQYAHARAHQLLVKAQEEGIKLDYKNVNLL
jgi:arginyl-tRNA synthetase